MEANNNRTLPPEKAETLNRRQRRQLRGEGQARKTRSGSATGTTPHFRLWKADLNMRSALQRMKTAKVAEAAQKANREAAKALAILSAEREYRNLFGVISAKREDLLRLNGIGPARLDALSTYLQSRNIKPSWVEA